MAAIYGNGDGVLMDLEEAVKWCRLAAEQGHMEAIFKLGESYYYGDGVKQNPTEAIKWLKLAADHGHPIALHYMGMVYYEGKILPQDYHRAITYFFIAEAQGIIDSSFMLGGYILQRGGG